MAFLFQHMKPYIIKLVANCSPNIDKLFIEKALIYNLDWSIRVFNALLNLGAKDIIVWFFLHIPYYNANANVQDIDKQRDVYIKMLDYFIANWPSEHYFTESEFIFISNQTCMPYAASYHTDTNTDTNTHTHTNTHTSLYSSYCKLLRKICTWLNYYSPSLAEKILKDKYNTNTHTNTNTNTHTNTNTIKKLKICFISDSFTTDTSVVRDRITIIGKLDRSKYDVYFASFNPYESISNKSIIAKMFMERIKSNYIYLGLSMSSARQVLEPYQFDFIVYPDIGMKLMPTLLAYSRIAPIQITTWGHSETSGIDTIDYFISSEIFEKSASLTSPQLHYTEKLILFKSLGTFYISPHKLFIDNNPEYRDNKKKFKTKEEYGFKPNQNLYVCLQTFYKLNPKFESCLARILELDPNGIILLSNTFPFCKSHLLRIRNIIGEEKLGRMKWYGSLEKDEFLNLVSICDVCLDPFPFGGFNTSYDAFDYNIPVITLEGEYLHGRFTSGLYRKMGLDECIVNTTEEYARLASSIGINEKLRHKINRNIEMKKHLIFQEQASVDEWNEIFEILK